MAVILAILVILSSNWLFSNLFGFWPESLIHFSAFVLKYFAIAILVIVFCWEFGD